MSCCPVWAGCAFLIGLEHVPVEVVVCFLWIAYRTPILDRESRFVPLVQPLAEPGMPRTSLWGQMLHRLNDDVRPNCAEIRVEVACHSTKRNHIERHQSADCRVLAGGVGRFTFVVPDHVDSSDFLVRISPRANPKDRVVIDGVLIDGRVGLSIRSVVASC
jgi:hypothetical protein